MGDDADDHLCRGAVGLASFRLKFLARRQFTADGALDEGIDEIGHPHDAKKHRECRLSILLQLKTCCWSFVPCAGCRRVPAPPDAQGLVLCARKVSKSGRRSAGRPRRPRHLWFPVAGNWNTSLQPAICPMSSKCRAQQTAPGLGPHPPLWDWEASLSVVQIPSIKRGDRVLDCPHAMLGSGKSGAPSIFMFSRPPGRLWHELHGGAVDRNRQTANAIANAVPGAVSSFRGFPGRSKL